MKKISTAYFNASVALPPRLRPIALSPVLVVATLNMFLGATIGNAMELALEAILEINPMEGCREARASFKHQRDYLHNYDQPNAE
jgi:hypothetical protein